LFDWGGSATGVLITDDSPGLAVTGENVRPPEIKSESYFLGDVGCGFVAHRLAVVAAGLEATSRANYLGNAQAEIRTGAATPRRRGAS
jgi:hypothetical protein